MKIIKKRFDGWDDRTKRRLRYATFSGGYMRKFMHAFPQSPTIVVFSQKQIMGWAFVLCNTHDKSTLINLFVNDRYRRRGLAILLVEETLKDFKTISLARWNGATRQLFTKLQNKHRDKITALDWQRNRHEYDEIIQKALF